MTGQSTGPVTTRLLAAEAGVSAATVSKVMNGRPGVSAATRDRVARVLDRHRSHRRPPHRRPGLVVDLVLNEIDSLWSAQIVAGADEVFQAAGTTMALAALHGSAAHAASWLGTLAARRCDGVVLAVCELTARQHLHLASLGVPVVLLDPSGGADVGLPVVGATNWAGAVAATEHLIALGHRAIAHLAGPGGVTAARARAAGYRTAMDRAGLAVRDGSLRYGTFDDQSGHREMLALLDEARTAGTPPPTAVFAASDRQALGACTALQSRGLAVPGDVSVVGFDDTPQSRWARPALTTVHQPVQEMAALAARTMLRVIDGESIDPPRVELATRLVVRDSAAPPPAG
ncbi:LacI family DNA-binding transcriptional regulator [Streptomyces sp. V4-01]|uniref:LacI family DNA-binding transcriptional regulator n=1 Tax=Actinacidiphila polyblastidii TaxID=3110430 RepID=A0ABU7PC20_9ACTN|nr:LacI family DNA-binding transcriptional regulator [Streptomyces sp. V4-01]